jgi:adenylate kinase family enzyme
VQRVWVAGLPGSGKTTLARTLADRLAVPHVELDALHHGPGWEEAPAELLRARVEAALAAAPAGWVVDGNYRGKLGDLVVARADTLVWVDLPLPLILARIVRRTASRLVRRTELWNGNRETLRSTLLTRESLVVWAVQNHRRRRRELEPLAAAYPGLRLVRLRRRRDVAQFLASVSPSQ